MDEGNMLSLANLAAAGAWAWKTPEIQKEIYGDLLKPGVSQVGKAIGSILGLGNTILLPIRLINGFSESFEKIAYEKYASKLSAISEEKINPIPPEIGVPILDRISYTRDENLQDLFVSLLVTASNSETAAYAHPSFVKIIGSLAPDEAKILKYLSRHPFPACVKVIEKSELGIRPLQSYMISPPSDCVFPENISAYISNLFGLGLLEISELCWPAEDEIFYDVLKHVRKIWPNATLGLHHGLTKENGIIAAKANFSMTPFGDLFIKSCI